MDTQVLVVPGAMGKGKCSMDEATGLLIALATYTSLFQSTPEEFRKTLVQIYQIDLEWLGTISGTFQVILDTASHQSIRSQLLIAFAVGMWEKGYKAAPKLEFVMPKEAEDGNGKG